MNRYLLAHGAVAAGALSFATLGAAFALRHAWIPFDQLVGGPPLAIRGSTAAVVALAALLPAMLSPRLWTWERVRPDPRLRTFKVLLVLGTALIPALLVAVQHAWGASDPGWPSAALNAISTSALAQLACALVGPGSSAPWCIALPIGALAVEQHVPASRELLSFVAATPAHPAPLTAPLALLAASSICIAATLGRSRWSAGLDPDRT